MANVRPSCSLARWRPFCRLVGAAGGLLWLKLSFRKSYQPISKRLFFFSRSGDFGFPAALQVRLHKQEQTPAEDTRGAPAHDGGNAAAKGIGRRRRRKCQGRSRRLFHPVQWEWGSIWANQSQWHNWRWLPAICRGRRFYLWTVRHYASWRGKCC